MCTKVPIVKLVYPRSPLFGSEPEPLFFGNTSKNRELQKLLSERSPRKLSSSTYLHHTTPNVYKSTYSETCIPWISTISFRIEAIFSATIVIIERYKRAMTGTCKNAVFWSVERAISRCRDQYMIVNSWQVWFLVDCLKFDKYVKSCFCKRWYNRVVCILL
jgi:hypothetical protein